jgi:hypothetical protein
MSPIKQVITQEPSQNPLEFIIDIFAKHLDAPRHYLIGLSLWALHTHVYAKYSKTPRLAILSPVPNCGKSTVLEILAAMVWNGKRVIDPTEAALFRLASNHTMLLDEVDNMSISRGMKSVLNEGDRLGGSVIRTGKDGEVISYPVFAPLALAGIGKLPATLMTRSLVIRLHRSDKAMERFSSREQYYASQLHNWIEQAVLSPEPQMPVQLGGRDADKWRPLISIADSLGRSAMAREAALKFLEESINPDIKELVLRDTQRIFNRAKVNKISVKRMHEKLLEDKEGEHEVDYEGQKITKRKIGDTLRDFQIISRVERLERGETIRYWLKDDFEEMWKRYA